MTARIEAMACAMFGSVAGGEFIYDMLASGKVNPDFSVGRMVLAFIGAGVLLGLLALMRKIVGPMRQGRSRLQNRD